MLSLNQIELNFGGHPIFRDISFLVTPGDRIGLIGRNGAGKSTLLKLIAGKYKPDGGSLAMPSGFKIGFLTQDIQQKVDITIYEETASCFTEIKHLEKKMEDYNEQLVTRTDYESDSYMNLIQDLHEAQERYDMLGGYTYQADMERVLLGLGFKPEDFHKEIGTFSGGWQMRVELAKILLQNNDVLLLDEPTNHLDIESILWLEQFLTQSNQAVIIVSHDRAFLNNATNRTIEIVLGKSYDFPVPYHKYVEMRADIREKQIQAKRNQEKEIKQTEQLIERFRAKASKASFAQNLIKRLDKMEVLEVDEEDNREMHFRFPPAPHSGKVTVRATDIHKSFGPKQVLKGIDLEVERGDKIAFVGQNGQGKSTLVKIILEELDYQGKVELGHQVKVAYYAQNQAEALDGDITVLKTIEDAADDEMRKYARNLLGNFMFSGDDVEKKVKVLSGGERGRLALCKMMLEPANLIVLDEPTNHLDMRAKDVLKQALQKYDGTLILVSHDREFLAGLATKTFEFREGKIKPYLGGIEYFLEQRKLTDMRELEKKTAQKKEEPKKEQNINSAEQKAKDKELRKLQNTLTKIEEEISSLETRIAEIEDALQIPESYDRLTSDPEFFNKYEVEKERLQELMSEWEGIQADIEELNEN